MTGRALSPLRRQYPRLYPVVRQVFPALQGGGTVAGRAGDDPCGRCDTGNGPSCRSSAARRCSVPAETRAAALPGSAAPAMADPRYSVAADFHLPYLSD